jgi:hypothetical protein
MVALLLLYGILLLENDNDEFRKKHGVKPKYFRCVTKGDVYCNHEEWCDAEKALYPKEYEAEMKKKENTESKEEK